MKGIGSEFINEKHDEPLLPHIFEFIKFMNVYSSESFASTLYYEFQDKLFF
jgi:hypothetical protein